MKISIIKHFLNGKIKWALKRHVFQEHKIIYIKLIRMVVYEKRGEEEKRINKSRELGGEKEMEWCLDLCEETV